MKLQKNFFKSSQNRYQNSLQVLMKGSELSSIMLIYCIINFIKSNPNCGGSYLYFPDRIKNKKTTISPIDKKDNKCFQYVVTTALNHEEIKKDPQK